MSDRVSFGDNDLQLTFGWDESSPVRLVEVSVDGSSFPVHPVPVVEIVSSDHGHLPASARLAHTQIGSDLRYVGHELIADASSRMLQFDLSAAGLDVTLVLRRLTGARAVTAQVIVKSVSDRPVVLRSVSSWSGGFTAALPADRDLLLGWERITGASDWLGEGRWSRTPLRGPDFPRLQQELTGQNPRDAYVLASTGTWSTGRHLPVGALESSAEGICIAWQVEHNGAWRTEIGEDTDGGYLSLSGPTDDDHAWTKVLTTGDVFTTVPVTVTWAADLTSALACLTQYRRLARRDHPDNHSLPVVFNDYMNTLNGDPTTEKLLPLIAAAADAGSEVFCIDAGWYDDNGHWWDSVGEWTPSTSRFPGGLEEVVAAIRKAGMIPGLWLEPEVIGVKSPAASTLPDDAFLQRHGSRIVEHHRYHLDMRHPAAIAHLDAVVDRLVAQFGVGFFKFDYNINPGAGTDLDADSPGDGLLQHNRAHLAWLDAVLDRHPALIIENCSSGAMRMDFAMLSRLAMQSTSDQQDFAKYPPIAAAAPMSMLPEQAASWAYPQPEMNDEEIAFCLVTGLLGRFYLSGYLNNMTDPQRQRVRAAVDTAKSLREHISTSTPVWPLGLPRWDDTWVALGLRSDGTDLVSVWRRGPSNATVLHLPHLAGEDVEVETIFPADLAPWATTWDKAAGTLNVHVSDTAGVAARTLRLTTRRAGA